MRSPRFLLALAVSLSVATGFVGCSKKAGETAQAGNNPLLAEPLLLKLPSTTGVFAVMDPGGEGYQLFRNSPYSGPADAKVAFENLVTQLKENGTSDEIVEMLRRLFDATVKIGVISPEGKYATEKVLSRVVVFGGPSGDANIPVDLGVFARAAKECDFQEKIKLLQQAITDSKLKVSPETINGAEAFSVSAQNGAGKMFLAASKSVFGATLSRSALEGLFSSNNTDTLEKLQALPEYKRATDALGKSERPLAFVFASFNRLTPLLEKVAKLDESGQFKPSEFPVDAVAVQSSFPQEYVHDFGVAVTPRTESQTKTIKALEGSSLPTSALKLPSDTAFSISFDGRFLGKMDSVIENLKQSTSADTVEQVKNLEGFTVGLRNNSSGSPVPDIFFAIDSRKREQLSTSLESTLGGVMSMTGQNTSWQSKDINGIPTKFFTTLVGAGAYLSSPKDSRSLLLGSSEAIMKDLLSVQSGGQASFSSTLSPTLAKQLSSANLAIFYVNFQKVADVVDAVKNTLAMFTGGNSDLNAALDSANIRSWGTAAGSMSYAPGVISAHSSFVASQVKK
jgi:hypothetical protein